MKMPKTRKNGNSLHFPSEIPKLNTFDLAKRICELRSAHFTNRAPIDVSFGFVLTRALQSVGYKRTSKVEHGVTG